LWETLKAGLYVHYGPTPFEDHFGDLTKLQKVGLVPEYQVQFEQLPSHVGKLSTQHRLGCFMSWLKENIRTEVQASKPTSITEAIGLARLFEARNWSLKKTSDTGTRHSTQGEPEPPFPSANLSILRISTVKKLSPAGLQDRRNCGLCFNCNEKFVPGHRCKKLFMIVGVYSKED
jgi:hypothetical protein